MRGDDLFSGLGVPRPPVELRRRTLAAARAAMAAEPSDDWWTRVWFSPRWRLAWLSAVIVLAAGHLFLSIDGPREAGHRAASLEPEIEELARLPRLSFDQQAPSALLATLAASEQPNHKEPSS
jgi:hypothetical protein